MTLPRILIVDDQYGWDATLRKMFMVAAGLLVETKDSPPIIALAEATFCSGQREEGRQRLNDYEIIREAITSIGSRDQWALILLDARFDSGRIEYGMPAGLSGDDSFGETVRNRLAVDFPDLPVVMLTSKHENELQGPQQPYLAKTGITPRIFSRALLKYGRLALEQQRTLLGLGQNEVAQAPASIKLFCDANAIADKDLSVLILGESGSGKEVLARYIHNRSARHNGPFVAINVAAIPADLVESELFGIEPRVASGVDGRPGKFEQARDGSLFLDEIGDMPPAVQAKVLRALQEKEILRIGGKKPIPTDIRILSATSRDLNELIGNKIFREDLFFRLNHQILTVPPLRERQEDILPLAEMFLQLFADQYDKKEIILGAEAKAILLRSPFRGNIREMEHLIHRLVANVGNCRVVTQEDMAKFMAQARPFPAGHSSPLPTSSPALGKPSLGLVDAPPGRFETLEELLLAIETFQVNKDDPGLKGAVTRLDSTVQRLRQRLAGAALERCRNPNDHRLNRQAAMQFLTGDEKLKGKGPGRVINEILGRKADATVTDDDLEKLVQEWSIHAGMSNNGIKGGNG